MNNQSTDDILHDSKDYMIAEYQRLIDSFWKSEDIGEKRVNFFITLSTVVVTVLIAFREKEISNHIDRIFFLGLVILLLFGIVTLMRIIHRNLESHIYLRAAGRIRRYFRDMDPQIQQYLFFGPFDDQPQRKKHWENKSEIFSFGTGGLVETVVLANSLIVVAILILLIIWLFDVVNFNISWTILIIIFSIGILGGFAAWYKQLVYVKHRYDEKRPKYENIHFPSPQEVEASLIIKSENPRKVAGQIADLTSINNYRLLPQDSKTIHDFYFDKPNRALQTKKFALRIRTIGTSHWITLKGPSQPSNCGGVKRLEIEESWSKDTLTKVFNELESKGIQMPQIRQDLDYIHPLNAMSGLGFEIVQKRESHRKIRNIVGEKNYPTLAEMAIDSTVYHFSNQNICHYEVEIEAKVGDSLVLEIIIKRLEKIYGPELQRWDYGKLATGKAIEKLLNEGGLEGMLDGNNNLKPAVYNKIADILKCGNV